MLPKKPLHINEIYKSIQGEGIKAGYPTIFVRTQGCSLRCVWCDTPYALKFRDKATTDGEGSYKTVNQVIDEVVDYGPLYQDVCLTGGDPLQQNHELIQHLIYGLVEKGYYIVIETGGHIPIASIINFIEENGCGQRVSFCVDYKLEKSGMNSKMKENAFTCLRLRDSIKFVIADDDDWNEATSVLEHLRQTNHSRFTALFSPVWESDLGIQGLAYKVINHITPRHHPVQLSLQLHKIIWDPAQRCT